MYHLERCIHLKCKYGIIKVILENRLGGVDGKFEIDKPIDIMKYQADIEKVVDMFLK